MSVETRRAIQREADFVASFTAQYRAKLAKTISLLNATHRTAATGHDPASMRFCIEAVDLVLASHQQFAASLAAGLLECID